MSLTITKLNKIPFKKLTYYNLDAGLTPKNQIILFEHTEWITPGYDVGEEMQTIISNVNHTAGNKTLICGQYEEFPDLDLQFLSKLRIVSMWWMTTKTLVINELSENSDYDYRLLSNAMNHGTNSQNFRLYAIMCDSASRSLILVVENNINIGNTTIPVQRNLRI